VLRSPFIRLDWWLAYNAGRDTQINGRVSSGNNAGDLANVLEKSLGGAKKGGNAPLMEVYEYAQPVTQHGLVFMDTPGYDPESATGQIAGGAHLICFMTGRGSCFGSVPVPTVKLARNTPMYARMVNDMDSTAASPSTAKRHRPNGPRDLRANPAPRFRRADQERGAGHRAERVRALAARRGGLKWLHPSQQTGRRGAVRGHPA
jgi:hypothetical protein